MNPRTTAILAVLAAALGAYIWFVEIGGEAERAEAEAAARRLFPEVDPADVGWLEVTTEDGEVARLERRGGEGAAGWQLVEPVDFRADELAAEGLVSSLADLESESVFEDPEPLAEYGLEGGADFRMGTGGESHAVVVGDKTPVGGNTYVRREGDPRVFAVPTWRVTALTKSLLDLRERRVLDFDREAVEAIRLRWAGGGVALEKGEQGWTITEPAALPADAGAVEDLLSSLEFLRAEGFADDPPPDAEAGLDEPFFVAELARESGEPVRLVIGTSDGEARLARGRAEGVLYRIAEARLGDFPRRVVAYRDRELASFAPADARRFELRFDEGGETLRVSGRRGETGWTVEPEPLAAGTASRMISELASLEAEDVAAESMGPAELAGAGLEPRVTLRVFGGPDEGNDALLAHVRLGAADPGQGIAAQHDDDPAVYWLDYERAEQLPIGLEAFRNRFLSAEGEEAGAVPGPAEPGPTGTVDPTGATEPTDPTAPSVPVLDEPVPAPVEE